MLFAWEFQYKNLFLRPRPDYTGIIYDPSVKLNQWNSGVLIVNFEHILQLILAFLLLTLSRKLLAVLSIAKANKTLLFL